MNPKKKGAILCAILVLDLLVNVAKRHTLSSVNHIHQNACKIGRNFFFFPHKPPYGAFTRVNSECKSEYVFFGISRNIFEPGNI